MTTTKHAQKRIKERVVSSKRQEMLALERGTERHEYSGSFRRYLDKLYHKTDMVRIMVYSNDIYIFNNGNLITVLKVPTKYLKTASKNKC